MSTDATRGSTTDQTAGGHSATRSSAYSAVIGLASLAVLLQAVWAGLFVHEGQEYEESWVEVHALGADIAIALTIIAAIIAFVRLRSRNDLVFGTVAMALLLVLEAYLGGLIGEHSDLTVIHFPLAMALMGLSVWLPFRATRATRA